MWKEIEEQFKWEIVHKTMEHLDWKWYALDESKVPSIKIIKQEAKRLCEEAYNKEKGYSIATGGLRAERIKKGIYLSFELTFALFP